MKPFGPSVVICLLVAGVAGGCDATRTTSQLVDFRISDAISKQPLAATIVVMKYDYHEAEPNSNREPYWLQEHNGVTDAKGVVSLDVRFAAIDRTIGSRPPSSRDWVTNHPYIIYVGKDSHRDEIHMRLKAGASATGKNFTLTVVAIHEPKYVKSTE